MREEWPGYCSICERRVIFRAQGTWHRDELVCTTCGSIPRMRALIAVLSIVSPRWRDARIWEVAPAGALSEKLRSESRDYVSSHYWPGVPLGTYVDRVRSEDIERPTFDDESIDIVVSSDVFEHVIDVNTALAQVARVLVDGGLHVWTAPQYRDLETSRSRVRRTTEGLEHLVPPEYHGDPVNPDGALVTYDWGRDLPDRVESASSMWTTVFRLESRPHGLLGEFLEVFVSHKGGATALAVDSKDEPVSRSEPRGDPHPSFGSAMGLIRSDHEVLPAPRSWKYWGTTWLLRALMRTLRRRGS